MISFNDTSPKILVIGDIIVDQYLWGSSERISPEAPVPVINIESQSTVLGGAGNVANNLCSLGANVDMISVIGQCEVAKELNTLLGKINVSTEHLITEKNRITSKKSRIIASQQQVVRYDRESSDDINTESQKTIIKIFNKIANEYEVILLSDYGKGVLTNQLTQSLINTAKKFKKKVLVDPKGIDYLKYKGSF